MGSLHLLHMYVSLALLSLSLLLIYTRISISFTVYANISKDQRANKTNHVGIDTALYLYLYYIFYRNPGEGAGVAFEPLYTVAVDLA